MTKTMVKTALAMALLAGCSESGVRGMDEAANAPANDTTSAGQGIRVDLRMRAIDAERFQNLLMLPETVQVKADGVPVQVEFTGELVNLAEMNQAAKVASVVLPEGTQAVEFQVALGAAGAYENRDGEGWVDTRSTTLKFVSPMSNLVEKGKAVIELNAAKSFVERDAGALVLVPKYRVEY